MGYLLRLALLDGNLLPRGQKLKARVVDCVFQDWQGGAYKVVGFHAKRARGMMARFAITHRISTPGKLAAFDLAGYAFEAAGSTPDRMVFRRRVD